MILIKDRHQQAFLFFEYQHHPGNMILIKDRHHSGSLILKKVPCEKYDIDKG